MFFPRRSTLPGVSPSLWEYAHDPAIARDDDAHLAGSPLLDFDRQLLDRWFKPPGTLIDLGCGTGRLLIPLAQRGFAATGVDLSPEALSVAKSRAVAAGVPVQLCRANLCELDCLPDGTFDHALLMFGTLGMIAGSSNRLAVLKQARRLLEPEGMLALHVHNVWSHWWHPDGRWWLLRDRAKWLFGSETAGDSNRDYRGIPNMYHHAFTRGELLRLLRRAGFVVDEIVPILVNRTGQITSPRWFDRFRATGWVVLVHTK